ncbi:hypothetical protein IQE94_17630 (plasmid) [Synechocystis sp. PCC 7339]|uniref:hypothetical protein n=1 Tax=Synechocystis sp. PCC 7339 TaxID=2782213 RepID=UPI001CBC8B1D|nr:hypothetical protein [Synechocystis sp. PCC 7339]UAJ74618.1 hypothetical protein IQE94_17630 [Synechocystis sp. PCC 7339]
MARYREYFFYYLLPDGEFHYGGDWMRNRSETVSDEEIKKSIPGEALALVYTEDVEYFGGEGGYKQAHLEWVDDNIETKLPGGQAIVDRFIKMNNR